MNERIVELAKQAHFYQADDNYFTAAQEEFARLIVKECIKAVDNSGGEPQMKQWHFNNCKGKK